MFRHDLKDYVGIPKDYIEISKDYAGALKIPQENSGLEAGIKTLDSSE